MGMFRQDRKLYARALRRIVAVAGVMCAALATAAAPLATAELVQAPAWLERDGVRQPLVAGMALVNGDIVHTGADARAYLALAEGSRVKLGAEARFVLHSRSLAPQQSFRGILNVAAGAFRFTTDAIRQFRGREREVTIRVGTATVGIRGTDLWGRSSHERDIVALLSGRIEITRGDEAVELAEPLTYVDAPRAGNFLVRPLETGQLGLWARETEILPGDGASRAKGHWRVVVPSLDDEREALTLYDRLRAAGFAARIRPHKTDDASAWRYEVFIAGYADRNEATAAAGRLARQLGIETVAGR